MTGRARPPGGSRRPRRAQAGRTGAPTRRPAGARDPARRQGRGLGGEQVEGRQAVRELLAAGRRRVRDVWLADGADDAPIVAEIAELAARLRVPVRSVSRGRLDAEARTDAPQGVLAHAEPLAGADLDQLL